jgi:Mlc titration factor MtfA (ptsG expression regulator)
MLALVSLILLIIFYLIFRKYTGKKIWKVPKGPFPTEWRVLLSKNVSFYNALDTEKKDRFEYKIQEFLLNCRITGIKTEVGTLDELLVASSAIIPIIEFDNWKYTNLFEVLLYPGSFDHNFQTSGPERRILGMVGSGYMEGKMILSKQALRQGFRNESDRKNTSIHEFVHLIDKLDGTTDGIPGLFLEKQYAIPWLDLIKKKIAEIFNNKSDINPYGGTNQAEFFAVVSEYFFEAPGILAEKHPVLYGLLERIFKQDMGSRNRNMKKLSIGRNSPCPCNSGLKFKKCCGKVHYG